MDGGREGRCDLALNCAERGGQCCRTTDDAGMHCLPMTTITLGHTPRSAPGRRKAAAPAHKISHPLDPMRLAVADRHPKNSSDTSSSHKHPIAPSHPRTLAPSHPHILPPPHPCSAGSRSR